MKVIIAGGRDFSDYDVLKKYCDSRLTFENIEIVSGCAKGADTLGERWASERGVYIKKFPANWSKWGKAAGFKRNIEMAEYANVLVAFWDGKSKGTEHMIKTANKLGLEVYIYKY